MIKPKIMLLIIITILGLSVGYSTFNAELSISGDASVGTFEIYVEEELNGTEPKLEDPLIAVTIEDDGTVRKAALNTEWYNYSEKRWANAVILKDESINYSILDIIPESNIESYFVWIPKYSYKLWDLGNYSSNTAIDESKVHSIEIRFGTTNTTDSVSGECTTPKVSEESGNCEVGDYMTHPAFLAFNTTGIWVGKFETGYDGARNDAEAENNTTEVNKVIVKPNVYSWRDIQVANAFTVSYNYKREFDSHLVKNTEWGAVAYLSHSIYGINSEIISGSYTWNTPTGYLTSTTGNITGIYDMSGGASEYVMGVLKDANGILISGYNSVVNSGFNGTLSCPSCSVGTDDGFVYGDSNITSITDGIDFPESKYYDAYNYSVSYYNKYQRILGDATGELGPFQSVYSSWYNSIASSPSSDNSPWFIRVGVFSYASHIGFLSGSGFRIVLAI